MVRVGARTVFVVRRSEYRQVPPIVAAGLAITGVIVLVRSKERRGIGSGLLAFPVSFWVPA